MNLKKRINDVHVHLGQSSIINQKLTPDQIFECRKKFSLDQMMLFSLDVDIEKNNSTVIELSKKYNFIHGLYWIKKSQISEDAKTISKELGNGLVGVKFHGVFENEPATSEIYKPIMEILADKKGILMVHCGRYKDGSPRSNSSYFHALEIAKMYPKIKVILAHMGGNDSSVVKKALQAAKEIPNAYFDTSGSSTPYRIEFGVEVVGAKRILFGSDFPWCSFRSMYYCVEDALINENEKEMILTTNFNEMLSY